MGYGTASRFSISFKKGRTSTDFQTPFRMNGSDFANVMASSYRSASMTRRLPIRRAVTVSSSGRHQLNRSPSERCSIVSRCADDVQSKRAAAELGVSEHWPGGGDGDSRGSASTVCSTSPPPHYIDDDVVASMIERKLPSWTRRLEGARTGPFQRGRYSAATSSCILACAASVSTSDVTSKSALPASLCEWNNA